MNRSILNGLLIKLLPSIRTHELFLFNDFKLSRKADHEAFLQRQARREAKFQAFLPREE